MATVSDITNATGSGISVLRDGEECTRERYRIDLIREMSGLKLEMAGQREQQLRDDLAKTRQDAATAAILSYVDSKFKALGSQINANDNALSSALGIALNGLNANISTIALAGHGGPFAFPTFPTGYPT